VRVLKKLDAGAPHAVLLVLDAASAERPVAGCGVFQDGRRDRPCHDQARRHRARRILVAVAEKYRLPSTSSASARAWTISKRFRRASLPARSPDSNDIGANRRYTPP